MAEARGPGREEKGASSDTDLARRLDRLSRDLHAEKGQRAAAEQPQRRAGTDYAQAFKLASEFVAGVLVGAGLGWGFDRLAGTSPWGLIVLLLLGFAAGVLNVVRGAGRMSSSGAADGGDGGKAG